MGTERSDALHHVSAEASSKFDYFMAGLCGALSGYVGQNLKITTLDLNGATLELAAVVCFVFAFGAALRRIELVIQTQHLNTKQLYHAEVAGQSIAAAYKGTPSVNLETGAIYTPQFLAAKAAMAKDISEEFGKRIDPVGKKGEFWYDARNVLLGVGMVALVAARLLPALGRP